MPKNVVPVIVDEEPLKKAAGAENIETVEINLGKIISKNEKRKEF